MRIPVFKYSLPVCLLLALSACANKPATVSPGPVAESHVADAERVTITAEREADAEQSPTPHPRPDTPPAEASEPTLTITPWRYLDADGTLLETANYKLYTTIDSERFLERIPKFCEKALEHYRTAIVDLPAPARRMQTHLFAQRDEWKAYTRQRLPENYNTFLKLGRGGYTTDAESVLFYLGRRSTFAITAHEGWHQYTQATFKHQLPIWMEEGLATYMEGHDFHGEDHMEIEFLPWRNRDRHYELWRAKVNHQLIPLSELLSEAPQEILRNNDSSLLIYYAQVWALTQFLAEGEAGRYRDALGQLILDAANGRLSGRLATSDAIPSRRQRRRAIYRRVGIGVVLEYFSRDFDEFQQQYEAFVDSITSRGSRRQIYRGENPLKRPRRSSL